MADFVQNTGHEEHETNGGLGFKRVLAYGNDSGTAQPIAVDSNGNVQFELASVADNPKTFEDTSFVVGDSPASLDCNTALGRNATKGYIINDGPGDFTVALSTDGAVFGDEATVKVDETLTFEDISVDTIRITHVADSAYRVSVI